MNSSSSSMLYSNIIETLEKRDSSIKLTKDEINYIIDNPVVCSKIEEEINNIIVDNQIDYHDIPQIIVLMNEIYKSHLIENEIQKVGIINIIRFTLDSILESNLIHLSQIELQIIEKIVNSSLFLLGSSVDFIKKEEEACFGCKVC
jgi:hypothetical protein